VDVSDGVHDSARSQGIRIFGQKCGGYDACLVLALFEMGIGEEEEEGGEGVLCKVVGEKLHGICADDGDVLIVGWCVGGDTESCDAVLDILGHLDAYFQAEYAGFGEKRCERNQETTKATANIGEFWGPGGSREMDSPVYGIRGMGIVK